MSALSDLTARVADLEQHIRILDKEAGYGPTPCHCGHRYRSHMSRWVAGSLLNEATRCYQCGCIAFSPHVQTGPRPDPTLTTQNEL